MRSGPSSPPGGGHPFTEMDILWGITSSMQKLCRGVRQTLSARCGGPVFNLKLVISTWREGGGGGSARVPRGAARKPRTCSPTLASLVDHIGTCTHLHTCTHARLHARSHVLHSPDEGRTNHRKPGSLPHRPASHRWMCFSSLTPTKPRRGSKRISK